MPLYSVQVIEKATDQVIEIIGEPDHSKQNLGKIARNKALRLNHDKYRVQIREHEEKTLEPIS